MAQTVNMTMYVVGGTAYIGVYGPGGKSNMVGTTDAVECLGPAG